MWSRRSAVRSRYPTPCEGSSTGASWLEPPERPKGQTAVRPRYPTPFTAKISHLGVFPRSLDDKSRFARRKHRSERFYHVNGKHITICGYSTVVSMRVFQTRDESSILSTRTIWEIRQQLSDFLISVSVNWANSTGVNIFIIINPKSVRL